MCELRPFDIINDATCNRQKKANDGKGSGFLEDSDQSQDEANAANDGTHDSDERNQAKKETDQSNNETGDAEAIFVYIFCHNTIPFIRVGRNFKWLKKYLLDCKYRKIDKSLNLFFNFFSN